MTRPRTRPSPARKKKAAAPKATPHEDVCALARARPREAAEAILKAHKEHDGNSTHAAKALAIAYQTIRKLITRLSGDVLDPAKGDYIIITFTLEKDGDPLSLEAAIARIRERHREREGGKNPPDPDEIRKLLEAEIERGTRQIDIAKSVMVEADRCLDDSLLSKFRRREREIVPSVLRRLKRELEKLARKAAPPEARQGRRTTPGGAR